MKKNLNKIRNVAFFKVKKNEIVTNKLPDSRRKNRQKRVTIR